MAGVGLLANGHSHSRCVCFPTPRVPLFLCYLCDALELHYLSVSRRASTIVASCFGAQRDNRSAIPLLSGCVYEEQVPSARLDDARCVRCSTSLLARRPFTCAKGEPVRFWRDESSLLASACSKHYTTDENQLIAVTSNFDLSIFYPQVILSREIAKQLVSDASNAKSKGKIQQKKLSSTANSRSTRQHPHKNLPMFQPWPFNGQS